MFPGDAQWRAAKPPRDGLESYRRLIELQKQMIQLAQQHEQSRRAFEVLRAQVAEEITTRRRERTGSHHRLRAAVLRLNWINKGKSSAC